MEPTRLGRLRSLLRERGARLPAPAVPTAASDRSFDSPGAIDAAFAAASAALARGDPGPAVSLARASLHADRRSPALAARAAALLDETRELDGAQRAVRARARWHAGELTAAREDATASLLTRDIEHTRGLVRLIDGELRSLTPGWVPELASTPTAATSTPQPGRVLHLVSSSRPWVEGGFAIRTHEVGRAQLGVELDPHIATAPGFPGRVGVARAPRREVLEGVTYHRLDPDARASGPADIRIGRAAAAFAALADELQPSLIAAAETASIHETTAQAALAVGRRAGLPVLLEVRGFRDEAWHVRAGSGPAPERYRSVQASDAATWSAADAIVTLGAAMRDELIERGVAAERITIVPNAIDPDRFQPGERNADLAAQLGIRAGDVVVGYIGSLAMYEGLDRLVDATRVLLDRGRPVRLLVVGGGEEEASLRARAGQLRLGDAARFTGRIPHADVLPYLHLVDLFVVPRPDQRLTRLVTPIKPIEALAAGCTVVVSDLTALRELVTDGVTGRTFPAADADALVDVLDALALDPDTRRRLAHAGSSWARSERTWAANGRRYRELVDRLTDA